MEKLINLFREYPITTYLIIVFGLSFLAFSFMWLNPRWQTPEYPKALPVWLLAVWSPTISAFILWSIQGRLYLKLKAAIAMPELSTWILILFVPLAIMLFVIFLHPSDNEVSASIVKPGTIALLLLLNLALGPLGEEAGWRGFLLHSIQDKVGWMGASIIIGTIWTLWHAPLWSIESPQSEINFLIFSGHVFCYSILMSIIYMESKGSLLPVIIFHLLVNVTSGYVSLLGTHSVGAYCSLSLYYYAGFTAVFAGLYELTREKACVVV